MRVKAFAAASLLSTRFVWLCCSWTIHTGFVEAGKFFVYVLIVVRLLPSAAGLQLLP